MLETGNLLQGFAITENKFQGVTFLSQIEQYGLIRPTIIDKPSKGLSPQQKAAHDLHAVTNRVFDKARMDNADDYSGYIEAVEVHKTRPGGTPAITLYHRDHLEQTENGLIIPYGSGIVAIDGETQTEARFILAGRIPETKTNPIGVTLYHGISVDEAMQILHDYNTKGITWNESKAARFNRTGQLSLAAELAIRLSGLPVEKVNYRGERGTKKHYVSLKQILTGIAGYQLNGKGSEVTVSASHFKRFNDADAISVPPTCTDHFSTILKEAGTNPLLGKAPPQIWQIAGVLLSKNFQPAQLNWRRAVETYDLTKVGARGGRRMPMKERLATIEVAMSSR